jgi:transposase
MIQATDVDAARRGRRRRPASEKLQIVRLTMEPGASVAEIARAHGVNANQVFKWRRLYERGQLVDGASRATALLPVTISANLAPEPADMSSAVQVPSGGAIHIDSSAGPTSALRAAPMQHCCAACWRACASDSSCGRNEDLVGCWRHRHAARLRRIECTGSDRTAAAAILRPCVFVPRPQR